MNRWSLLVSRGKFARSALTLALGCGALWLTQDAQAVLGATQDTLQADQINFRGVHSQRADWQMTTHEISLADGSSIREYVNPAGLVFAVSWHSRLKPRLETLLGAHYVAPGVNSNLAAGVSGVKRQQSLRHPNLVLHQSGRMNAFSGLAYVPTLVPPGVNADALR